HSPVAGLLADLSVARVLPNYSTVGVDCRGDLEMRTARDVHSAKLVDVIDDDPMVLEAMSGLLRSWGYQVLTAGTTHGAIASPAAQRWGQCSSVDAWGRAGGRSGVQARG